MPLIKNRFMFFYNNIFASSYKYYSKFKRESPSFSATCIVVLCQMTMLCLILVILMKFTGINVFSILPNKLYFLLILALWFFLTFRYYRKDKIDIIIQKFEKKSNRDKKVWGVLTLFFIIVPIILIALLLTK